MNRFTRPRLSVENGSCPPRSISPSRIQQHSVSVDIGFGQKYFIKPWIEWGLKKRGYNFKLHVEHITDHAIGAAVFDEVKMK